MLCQAYSCIIRCDTLRAWCGKKLTLSDRGKGRSSLLRKNTETEQQTSREKKVKDERRFLPPSSSFSIGDRCSAPWCCRYNIWAVREKYNSLNQELNTTHLHTHICVGCKCSAWAWHELYQLGSCLQKLFRWQKPWLCQQHEWITESTDNLDTLQITHQKYGVMSDFRFYAAEAHSHVCHVLFCAGDVYLCKDHFAP